MNFFAGIYLSCCNIGFSTVDSCVQLFHRITWLRVFFGLFIPFLHQSGLRLYYHPIHIFQTFSIGYALYGSQFA